MTTGLSADQLAERAGVSVEELESLVELGILAPEDDERTFRPSDVQRVRLAKACEAAGLPMDGIAQVIEQGLVSLEFVEASAFRRWSQRSDRTYREVSLENDIPIEGLQSILEAFGYARMGPDDLIREDELEVVPLLKQGIGSGILDRTWLTRLARAHAQRLWKVSTAWKDAYHARFEMRGPRGWTGAVRCVGGRGSRLRALGDRGGSGADGGLPTPTGADLDRAPGRAHRERP